MHRVKMKLVLVACLVYALSPIAGSRLSGASVQEQLMVQPWPDAAARKRKWTGKMVVRQGRQAAKKQAVSLGAVAISSGIPGKQPSRMPTRPDGGGRRERTQAREVQLSLTGLLGSWGNGRRVLSLPIRSCTNSKLRRRTFILEIKSSIAPKHPPPNTQTLPPTF